MNYEFLSHVAHLSRVAHLSCLLLLSLWPALLSAQNGVTVSNLSVGAGTVTFKVSWDKNASDMPTVWSDSVWVFVDYNDAGVMKRLPLAPGATLTTHTAPEAGRVIQYDGNDKGVWVVGNARTSGSFSATVQLLTATADIAGACVYASNYPPVGKYLTTGTIKFTGTPPYALVLKQAGGATHTGASLDGTYLVPEDFTVESFTDKTGAPGIFTCMPPATPVAPAQDGPKCAGTAITFTASTISGATEYEWQGHVTGGGTAATSDADIAGTYLAQVRAVLKMENTTCHSDWSDATTATILANPTITLLSGSTDQYIDLSNSITPIEYTTANATDVSISGQPDGVGGSWSTNTYTISGTPTTAGTYNYTVTASHSNGCAGTSLEGRLLVTQPWFASSQTYSVGGYTWSDASVYIPSDCTLSPITTVTSSEPRYYIYSGRYFYNGKCFAQNKSFFCPDGWELPAGATCTATIAQLWYDQVPESRGYIQQAGAYSNNLVLKCTNCMIQSWGTDSNYFCGWDQNGHQVRCVKK
jgi:hypothetical protein